MDFILNIYYKTVLEEVEDEYNNYRGIALQDYTSSRGKLYLKQEGQPSTRYSP